MSARASALFRRKVLRRAYQESALLGADFCLQFISKSHLFKEMRFPFAVSVDPAGFEPSFTASQWQDFNRINYGPRPRAIASYHRRPQENLKNLFKNYENTNGRRTAVCARSSDLVRSSCRLLP